MSTQKIDFTNLTLKDALDLAVLIEQEAQDRYGEFADQMDQHRTPDAAAFFRTMVENEAKHGRDLLARRQKLFGDAPVSVDRTMIFDVEAPDYNEARAFMTEHAALRAARTSEIKAHDFFVAALPRVQDPEVRKLFEELRDEEMDHQAMVERELAKRGPEPSVSPESFVDDPAPQ